MGNLGQVSLSACATGEKEIKRMERHESDDCKLYVWKNGIGW